MSLHTDHRALVAVAVGGLVALTLIIGVLPAFEVQKTGPHLGAHALEALERRGRELYLREGCGFCHTQFVRSLPVDKPYGRGSVPEDYALEDPPLLGTQRTGPDLANVGVRQPSEMWNLIHLYNPRAVVPQSVMPGYPWYFEEKDQAAPNETVVPVPASYAPRAKVVVATEDALALVRYLQWLKQPEVKR
ncbi:MAG: cbb3-type cytochrome c oxidase subunit II [Gammaproteobacteria bacterium]